MKNIFKTIFIIILFFSAKYSFALVVSTQPDSSVTFDSCVSSLSPFCFGYSDYSTQNIIPVASTMDEIKFYGNAPTGSFFVVTFYNITNPGPQIYFAPNNYVAGKTDGTDTMQLYTLQALDFSTPIVFNGTDTWALSIFAYGNNIPCNVQSCYKHSSHLGNSSNQIYYSITGHNGDNPPCIVDCFSNVLFLPGIKGSVLKNGSDTLWPPSIFSFNDVSQLALTSNGDSVNDIHTEGILDTVYGTPIYSQFSNFVASLVTDETIE